jgi:hypothetical protein
MRQHRPYWFLRRGLFSGLLLFLSPAITGALESTDAEEIIPYYDIIDTLEVVDSPDDDSNWRIRRSDIELDPSCLYQDVYKHTLATRPLDLFRHSCR